MTRQKSSLPDAFTLNYLQGTANQSRRKGGKKQQARRTSCSGDAEAAAAARW